MYFYTPHLSLQVSTLARCCCAERLEPTLRPNHCFSRLVVWLLHIVLLHVLHQRPKVSCFIKHKALIFQVHTIVVTLVIWHPQKDLNFQPRI
ncbi:hypothetical protein VPHD484_0377 [Vibrio phage D484]